MRPDISEVTLRKRCKRDGEDLVIEDLDRDRPL
jgi:hypothetical protein